MRRASLRRRWSGRRFFLDTAAIALRTPTIGIASCLALSLAIGLRSRSLGLVVALGSAALLVRPVQAGEQKPSMSRWGGQPARLLRKVCHVTAVRGLASSPEWERLPVYTLTFETPPSLSNAVRIDCGDVVKVVVPNFKPKSYSMSAERPGEFDITVKVYPGGVCSGYLDSVQSYCFYYTRLQPLLHMVAGGREHLGLQDGCQAASGGPARRPDCVRSGDHRGVAALCRRALQARRRARAAALGIEDVRRPLLARGDRGAPCGAPRALQRGDNPLARAARGLLAWAVLGGGAGGGLRRCVGHCCGRTARRRARRRPLPERGHQADDASDGGDAARAGLRDAGPPHAARVKAWG
eukprot:scaffold64201_cov58-Phaeocystis_antarctica.AAC.2